MPTVQNSILFDRRDRRIQRLTSDQLAFVPRLSFIKFKILSAKLIKVKKRVRGADEGDKSESLFAFRRMQAEKLRVH